jgi:hypothetical protein
MARSRDSSGHGAWRAAGSKYDKGEIHATLCNSGPDLGDRRHQIRARGGLRPASTTPSIGLFKKDRQAQCRLFNYSFMMLLCRLLFTSSADAIAPAPTVPVIIRVPIFEGDGPWAFAGSSRRVLAIKLPSRVAAWARLAPPVMPEKAVKAATGAILKANQALGAHLKVDK